LAPLLICDFRRRPLMRKEKDNRTWLPNVLLEIPELDEDHQRLLSRVNTLLAAVASSEPAVVQSALSELRSETEAHFAREETLMREAHYPGLKQHLARHRRLLRELSTLRVTLDASGKLRVPLAPMNYIRRWFAAHITGDDRMVASYLDEKEERFLFGLA
jgi:hemerythrin-like metal-binding protein